MPRLVALAALVVMFIITGCGGSSGGGGSAETLKAGEPIGMKSLKFHPDNVKVPAGQKVTWHNDESIPHDVSATSGADFKSSTFGKDGTFSFTPTKAGTIKYECTLHPGMTGQIQVVAK